MTQSKYEKVQIQLYDLLDTTKFELSELNQNKALVINGPDSKLIQRGFDIAYYQGQKKAIDAIDTLLNTYNDMETFLPHFETYSTNYSTEYQDILSKFESLNEPTDEFEYFIAQYYQLKGQVHVINTIRTTIHNNMEV
ncbi:hypothetical protein BUZ14_02235 [Staphylococcus gallinarum]|uniref:Uncharacterized protein n=1 Tax=Staphylococcus gallinarum TaxID=1293 RepID=A0A3A0VSK7_STAGA|nr:hypothetical protein [Staphylococcus gallinarum]RIP37394.1 hypothetical protein BUZ14_02235 [Staphylococcus gallinarum]